MKVNRKRGEYGQPRCCICGRFVKYSDLDGKEPKALVHFTQDTAFSSEAVYWEHVECSLQSEDR